MENMNLFELGEEQISTSSFETLSAGDSEDIHLHSNHGWKPSSDSHNEFIVVNLSHTF